MSKCVTIIPTVNHNKHCCFYNAVALRTHMATCDGSLIFIDHHALDDDHKTNSAAFKQDCENHGARYHYTDEKFNISRYLNIGMSLTDSEYVVFGSADLIFYPGWLDALYEVWGEHPHLNSIHPFSYDRVQISLNYRDRPTLKRAVPISVETQAPPGWIGLFRRNGPYKLEERLAYWEADCNYWLWLKKNNLYAGVAYNSRVDNLCAGIRDNADPRSLDGYDFAQASQTFKEIWNLPK